MGDDYIGVVAEGLKRIDFEKVDIKGNRLNEKGAKKLIKNLRPTHKSLDLSNNCIGKSTSFLKNILSANENKLQVSFFSGLLGVYLTKFQLS